MRRFETGATRDSDDDKLDYEGFLSPIVLQRYAEYMHQHRIQADGELRSSDNWQHGIPRIAYMKSLLRHTMDVWLFHRGSDGRDGLQDALCGVIFNAMGYLYEVLADTSGVTNDVCLSCKHLDLDEDQEPCVECVNNVEPCGWEPR